MPSPVAGSAEGLRLSASQNLRREVSSCQEAGDGGVRVGVRSGCPLELGPFGCSGGGGQGMWGTELCETRPPRQLLWPGKRAFP